MTLRRCACSFLVIAGLSLAGCASPRIPVVYTAQNAVRGQASVQMGTVNYAPADAGKVKPNQFENTAIGTVKLDTEIAQYVKRALALELDHSGFTAKAPEFAMDCTVEQVKIDDLGFSADWKFSLSCVFRRLGTPEQYTQGALIEKKKLSKFTNLEVLQRYFNGLIVDAYEQIMTPETVRVLSTPVGTALPQSDPLRIGATLYSGNGATFGRVTMIEPKHSFSDGRTGKGVRVMMPPGTEVWLSDSEAKGMLKR